MILPEGVNPLTFLNICQQKGVKITSRFKGVSFCMKSGRQPHFKASFNRGGKTKNVGEFHFSIQGELEAKKAYEFALAQYELEHGLKKKPGPRATT